MALTRVAPAGIGSTPGTGYVIGDSFLHSRGVNTIDGNYTGIVTTQSLRVIGDLEVEGTTTTLDTALTEVDKLEVGANNTTVGVAITQSGTGDILNLYDGATEVFSVLDGGAVRIDGNVTVNNSRTNTHASLIIDKPDAGTGTLKFFNNGSASAYIQHTGAEHLHYYLPSGSGYHAFYTNGSNERLRITSSGYVGIGSDNPTGRLDIQDNFESRFAIRLSNTMGNGRTYGFRSHGSNGEAFTVYHGNIRMQQWDDYQAGGNTVFYSSGNESFRVNHNGNIGIGTNNPTTKVHSDLGVFASPNQNSFYGYLLRGDCTTNQGYAGYRISLENSTADFGAYLRATRYAGSTFVGLEIGTDTNNRPIRFLTGGVTDEYERLRIQPNGKVGIGTDNPFARVTVEATVNTSAFAIAGNLGTNNGRAFQILTPDTDSTSSPFRIQTGNSMVFQTDDNDCLYLGDLGHVGIHTLNPTFGQSTPISTYDPKFGVNGSVMIGNLSTTASDRSELQFYRRPGAHSQPIDTHDMGRIAWYGSNNDQDNASLAWSIGVNPDGGTWTTGSNRKGYMTFNNHNGEQVRINSSGNVGIGSDTPQKKLDVAGDVKIVENSPRLEFHDANSSTLSNVTGGFETFDKSGNRATYVGAGMENGGNIIEFGTNNTFRAIIDSSGNVGINETSPDTYLHVKTGADSALVKLEQTATNGRVQIQYLSPHGNWYQGIVGASNSGDYLIYTGQSKNLTFHTNGELRQKIQSDGKVIIGGNANQTANRDLSVVAAQGNSNEVQLGLQPTNSSGNYNPEVFISAIADGTYGAHMYFKTRDTSGNRLERLRIQSNGILRLSTPGSVVDGTFFASQTINNTGSNTYSRIRFDRSNVAKFGLTLRNDDKFCISNLFKGGSVTADDNAFVMDVNSKIGIGHANPDSIFHVYSSANHAATFEYSSTSDCAIQLKNTQGSIFFGLGGNEGFGVSTDSDLNGSNNRFMILQDGKTGINNVSPPVRLAIAESNDVKMLLSSSWGGTGQILFGGSSNSTGAANSTAAIIKCTSSAPSGAAVGQLQFIVNNGDDFDDDRLTIYPQGLGNAKTNGGPALQVRSGLSISNPVASTAMRIRPQFYDADCGAGFAYFQMGPSSSDSTPTLVWRFGTNVKMAGEITLNLVGRTNSPSNAQFRRLNAKYRFAFYAEGDNDGSGLRHLTEIYRDSNGANITSVSIVYVDNGHSQYGTNNDTWKDGYGYFKFNFSGVQGHAISCKIDLTNGLGYVHEAYFE